MLASSRCQNLRFFAPPITVGVLTLLAALGLCTASTSVGLALIPSAPTVPHQGGLLALIQSSASKDQRIRTLLSRLKLPADLESKRPAIVELFARQIEDAQSKIGQAYWTSRDARGEPYNVGRDVQIAAQESLQLLLAADPTQPGIEYLVELARSIHGASAGYRLAYEDPDGFGIATYKEIIRDLIEIIGSIDPKRAIKVHSELKLN